MSWKADAEISGVMAGIGSSLLRGFATKKVTEIFDGITKSLEEHSQK
jgi:carbon monoxide dehydrogenase subunit G